MDFPAAAAQGVLRNHQWLPRKAREAMSKSKMPSNSCLKTPLYHLSSFLFS